MSEPSKDIRGKRWLDKQVKRDLVKKVPEGLRIKYKNRHRRKRLELIGEKKGVYRF